MKKQADLYPIRLLRRGALPLTIAPILGAALFLVALYAVAATAFPGAAAGAPTAVEGICLKQRFSETGSYTAQITPNAIRVEDDRHEYYVISKAPKWDVSIVRPKTREIFTTSHRDWCEKYEFHGMSWTTELKTPLRTTSFVKYGLPVKRCIYGSTEEVNTILVSRQEFEAKTEKTAANHAEVEYIEPPGCKMTGPVMWRMRGLRASDGVVLSIKRVIEGQGPVSCLVTEGLKCGVKIAPDVFDLPKEYKPVPFHAYLIISGQQGSNIKGLFSDYLGK